MTSPALFNLGSSSGSNSVIQPSLNTGGTLEVSGNGALTLLGSYNVGLLYLGGLSGTVAIGEGGTQGALAGGGVDLACSGCVLRFNRSDNISFGPLVFSGVGTLRKAGSGALTFTSTTATHQGAVEVTEGTLLVNGVMANSTLAVTVSNGATLGGTNGTINRPITLNSGAILAPGGIGAVGTLNVGGSAAHIFSTSNNTQLNFQLAQAGVQGGAQNDFVNATGNLAFGAGTVLSISHSSGGTLAAGTYPLFEYTGTATGSESITVTGMPSGLLGAVVNDTANKVVNLQLIPANLRWAPNSAACAAGTLGGTGTWDASATNWCDTNNVKKAWAAGATAVFPENSGTVTVSGSHNFNSLDFQVSGMTLNGGTLTGTTGTETALTAGSGTTATVNSALAGSLPYTKMGAGMVVLGGANAFTGAMTVSAGTLRASSTNALGTTAGGTSVQSGAVLDVQAAPVADAITLNGSAMLQTSATNGSLSGSVVLGSASTVQTDGVTQLTLSGVVSGASNPFTKNGTGRVILSGANTYTGATVVNAGSLFVGAGSTTGLLDATSQVNLAAGTTLGLNRSNAFTFANTITGSGGLLVAGSGVTLSGNNTYTGTTSVNAGTLVVAHANALGGTGGITAVNSGASLDIQIATALAEPVALQGGTLKASAGTRSMSGALDFNSDSTVDVGGTQLTLTGAVTGAAALTKIGTGHLIMAGASNTQTGAITVNAGALWVNGNLSSSANAVTVATGATLGGSGTINRAVTLNGAARLEPGSASSSVGTLKTNAFAASSTSLLNFELGAAGVPGGSSSLNDWVEVTGNLAFTAGATLNISQSTGGSLVAGVYPLFKYTGTLTGGVLPTMGTGAPVGLAGTLVHDTINKVVSLKLALPILRWAPARANCISGLGGAGTWDAATANWCNPSNAKVAWIPGATAQFLTSSGTVTVSGSHAYDALDFQIGGYTLNGGTLTGTAGPDTLLNINTGTTTIGTTLAGSLPHTKSGSGTLTLTGANTFTAVLAVNAGSLNIGSGSTTGSIASDVSVASGATLVFNRSDSTAFNAVISGAGALTKQGAGTLSLGGNSSFTGLTTVSVGTLAVTHANALGSTTTGTTVASGAVLDIQGAAVGAEPVTLNGSVLKASTGTGSLSGTLTFSSSTANTIDVGGTELTLSGQISGNGNAWTKSGVGRLVLTATPVSVTQTSVLAGKLLVNSPSWANNGQNMLVFSGATVGGAGTIGQNLTLASGTTLEPGGIDASGASVAGTLTMNQSAAPQAGSQMNFQLGEVGVTGGLYNDFVNHTIGAFSMGGTINISATPGRTLTPGSYPLVRYSDLSAGVPTLGTLPAGMSGMLVNNTSTRVLSLVLLTSNNLRWAPNASADCVAGTNLGGTGTWDAATANWCPEGGSSKVPWVPGSMAVFPGSGGTVTVSGAHNIAGVDFQTSGVTITGGTSLTGTAGAQTLLNSATGVSSVGIATPLAGTLPFVKNGDGALTLSGANTFNGAMAVSAGTLTVGNASGLGTTAGGTTVASGAVLDVLATVGNEAVTLSGGTLRTSTGTGSLSGTVTLTTSSVMDVGGTSLTLSGVVSGAGDWSKTGAGNLIVTATSTATGPLSVSGGKLVVGNGIATTSNVDSVANIALSNNAVLRFNVNADTTFSKVISGNGRLEKAVASRTLYLTGENTYTGSTTVEDGTLQVGNGATGSIASSSDVNLVATSSRLTFGRSGNTGFNQPISGLGNLSVINGTVTLGGNNSFTGPTSVSGGTLALAHNNALGTSAGGVSLTLSGVLDLQGVAIGAEVVTVSGGMLRASTGTSSLAGTVTFSNTTDNFVEVSGTAELTLEGVVTNTSGPTQKWGTGTLVLKGANVAVDGSITALAGKLLVNAPGALSSTSASSSLTMNAGSTLGGSGTIARAFINLNGTLEPGLVGDAGTLKLGSASRSTVFATANGAQMNFQLGAVGVQGGALNDWVDVTGSLSFAAGTTLNIIPNGGPLVDGSYPLFKYTGTIAGLAGVTVTGTSGALRSTGTEVFLDVGSQTLRWAPNASAGQCASSTNLGGSGTWDAGTANWCNATGSKTAWISGSSAVFPGSGGTVTVSGTHNFKSLDFQVTGVTITGSTLTGTVGTETLLNAGSGITATVNSVLAGSLPYAKSGAGSVTLGGANTFAGSMEVREGTLGVSNASGLGTTAGGTTVASGAVLDVLAAVGNEAATLNGGTLRTSMGTGSLSGAVALTTSSVMDVGGTSLTLSGVVSGSGDWSKTGTGDLIVTATNTATGALTVHAGTFVVDDAGGNIGGVSGVEVKAGATLKFHRSTPLTFTRVISGGGDVEQAGTNQLLLTGTNTYTGKTIISAGWIRVGDGATQGSIGDTSEVVNKTTLIFSRSDSVVFDKPITNTAADAGDIQKVGAGTLILRGDNTYRGVTYVNAGTLAIEHANALGATVGNTRVTGAKLDLRNVTVVGEAVSLESGGTLQTSTGISSLGGALSLTAAGSIDVASSAQLTVSGAVVGNFELAKTGVGRLVLSGSSANPGTVNIDEGTLVVNGTVPSRSALMTIAGVATLAGSGTINRPVTMISGATLEPGNVDASGNSMPGKLKVGFDASSTFTAAGTLKFQLSEAGLAGGASALNDWVDVTGNLTFSAGTTLSIPNGGSLADGTYPLFRFSGSTVTGLAGVTVTGVANAQLISTATEVFLVVGSPTLRWAPNASAAQCVSSTNLGGNGSWEGSLENWCNGNLKSAWVPGATAVFPGAASTVNVIAPQTFKELIFQTSNVAITGGTLTGPGTGMAVLRNDSASNTNISIGNVLDGLAFAKEGAGAVTLSGANTFTGSMSLNGGTLAVSNASGLGTTAGGTTVGNGATLDILASVGAESITLNNNGMLKTSAGTGSLGGTVTLMAGSAITEVGGTSLTLSGVVSGSGDWSKTGTGDLIVTATSTATGALTVSAGKFVVNGAIDNVASVNVAASAVLAFDQAGTTTFSKVISGAGALEKLGSNGLTLTGVNTYTGATHVKAGLLQIGNGTTGATDATSQVNLDSGATLAFNRNQDIAFDKVIQGAGVLRKSGSGVLTLTADNSYTGTTEVLAGTLQMGDGGTTGSIAATGSVALSGGHLAFNRSDNIGFNKSISGTGTLSKRGTGTLALAGTHSYGGATSVDGGTLLVNGTLATSSSAVTVNTGTLGGSGTINRPVTLSGGSASLAPGDATVGGSLPGTLTVVGDFTMQGSSKLLFQLDGAGGPSGSLNDRVQVTGSLSFSGTSVLDIALSAGSNLDAGNYTLFTHTGTQPSVLPATGTLPAGVVDAVMQNSGNQVQLAIGSSTPILSGKVFNDGGAPAGGVNAGIPNDGVRHVAEAGLSGVAVSLTNCSGTVFASTVTDAVGSWTLNTPPAQVGTSVCVGPTLPSGYHATGASAAGNAIPDGSSSGGYTYSRAQHRMSFAAPVGGTVVLDFGQVPVSQWSAGSSRSGAPGTAVLHAHQFTAGSGGSVVFSTGTGTGVPSNDGWNETVYLDANCTGTLQPGAQVVYPTAVPASQVVTQGQTVCLLVQQGIPGSALNNQSRTAPVQAQFSFTNANPALSASYSVNDVTTVGASQLDMRKDVRVVGTLAWSTSNQAKSGQELEYRITIRNTGPAPIRDVRVTDHTPAYTIFKDASAGSLPASLGACAKTTPASAAAVDCSVLQTPGGTGPIQWIFSGSLNEGPEVELRYVVEVN